MGLHVLGQDIHFHNVRTGYPSIKFTHQGFRVDTSLARACMPARHRSFEIEVRANRSERSARSTFALDLHAARFFRRKSIGCRVTALPIYDTGANCDAGGDDLGQAQIAVTNDAGGLCSIPM
eukprot:3118047-Amphidinium_carterae.2